MHMPPIQRTWSIGSIISAVGSMVVVISVAVGLIWGYAGVAYASRALPSIQARQEIDQRDIAVLKIQMQMQMRTEDERFREIQQQYLSIDSKLSQLNQDKVDKKGQ